MEVKNFYGNKEPSHISYFVVEDGVRLVRFDRYRIQGSEGLEKYCAIVWPNALPRDQLVDTVRQALIDSKRLKQSFSPPISRVYMHKTIDDHTKDEYKTIEDAFQDIGKEWRVIRLIKDGELVIHMDNARKGDPALNWESTLAIFMPEYQRNLAKALYNAHQKRDKTLRSSKEVFDAMDIAAERSKRRLEILAAALR